MAHELTARAAAALEGVRRICLGFPGAEEFLSHGAPSFRVRGGKLFLMFTDDHHGSGRVAVWIKSTHECQRALVAGDAARFFVPPYVGVSGWVGAWLDLESTDWIELAILVEEGWLAIAPKRLADTPRGTGKGERVARSPGDVARPAKVAVTSAKVARAALERLTKICLALPEASCERSSRHAEFRVRKKVFAYFLDDHHGDGIVAVCFKGDKAANAKLVKSAPKLFYVPAYLGARGWIGVRLDSTRVDWKDVAQRAAASYGSVAPKTLIAQLASR